MIQHIFAWLPHDVATAVVRAMPRRWIEHHLLETSVGLHEIFYEHTWSLALVDAALDPEHTQIWDDVSSLYELSEAFCESNIEHLNFHSLVYCQRLPLSFYQRHRDRITWIAPSLRASRYPNTLKIDLLVGNISQDNESTHQNC